MLQSNSSTSSSEQAHAVQLIGHKKFRQRIIIILLWTVGSLILIDTIVGFIFRYPSTPQTEPSTLQRYFDYGRSIEGKLRHYIGSSPEQDAAIMKAGWLKKGCDVATITPPNKLGIDIYGMSFTSHIADHMEQLDSGLAVQRFAGPGAPPNHSYACYIRRTEANRTRAPVQILGVLASSIRRMETIGGLTTSFEGPQPFTYPRYSLDSNGNLVGHYPTITTQNELHEALADAAKWSLYLNDLATNDTFYTERIVKADVFDHSVIARMIRRAWGQRIQRDRTTNLRTADKLSGESSIAPVFRAMLIDFAFKVRQDGKRPVIILIEDQGYGGVLSTMAASALRDNHIEFISTSSIVSPDDSGNYLADGHFTPVADEKIARAVLDLLGRNH